MKQRDCVYVVGAGFSAGLGYPLISGLLVRLWDRIDPPHKRNLKRVIEFHHPGFDPKKFTSFPNVEQLLSEMLVNEELFDASRRYEGKFTKKFLQDLQRYLLLNIAEWFHEISKKVKPAAPRVPWLDKFRQRVHRENAAIISFNWDLILDELLFGDEISSESYGFPEGESEGPILLKPHGSLNWFEEDPGKFLKNTRRINIFDPENQDSVYAFKKFRAPVSKKRRIYAPLIVPPVYLKNFEKPIFTTLWNNCTAAMSTTKTVVFLGYSMPAADLHAKFIMRCGFHNQVDGELDKARKRKKPTGPAEVIIVNPDQAAAQRIVAVVGPGHNCTWVSTPVADWIEADTSGN